MIECSECGGNVPNIRGLRAKTCGPECAKRRSLRLAREKTPIRQCGECGNDIPRARGPGARTCGQECAKLRNYRFAKESEATARPTTRECVVCTKPFEFNGRQIICSPECRDVANAKRALAFRAREEAKLEACNEFEMPPRRAALFETFVRWNPHWPDEPVKRDPNISPDAVGRRAWHGRIVRSAYAAPLLPYHGDLESYQ